MIFQTKNAINKILKGEKTQTRRIVKPEHRLMLGGSSDDTQILRVSRLTTSVYEVGKTYAVQPGRGKSGVVWYTGDNPLWDETRWDVPCDGQNEWWRPLRIRITEIQFQDVRHIGPICAKAEGYETPNDFLLTWCRMHDKVGLNCAHPVERLAWIDGNWGFTGTVDYEFSGDELAKRPAKYYEAWALTFEMVK